MRYAVFFLLLGAVFAFQKRHAIEDWMNPPEPVALPAGTRIALYATEWCGYCAKARALLKARQIPYVEYDIEKSEEGYRNYERLGGRGVPVLTIGDTVIHGYDRAAIDQALEKL